MIRILYFSTARANINRAEVDRIVAHAAEKNAGLGITGALAYNGRNFCQLLEGEESLVRALVDVIAQDTRHSGFKIIDECNVSAAHFDGWSMKLVKDLDFSEVINAMKA